MSARHVRLVVAVTAVAVLAAAGARAQAPSASIPGPAPVQVARPTDGAVVADPHVVVTGRAEPGAPTSAAAFDVMIVIDTSGSTRVPAAAAATASRGGVLGIFNLGGPSTFDSEVTAAERLVAAIPGGATRIGIITFSEGSHRRGNAWLEQPLTADARAVRAALERLARQTPNGGTDMVAGVRLAIRELMGLEGAASPRRPEARKVALLMTDGFPTLPFGGGQDLDPRNVEVTLDAVRVAAKAGIVMHTFCLGREALSAPVVCREAARMTGGSYHAVQNPADIVQLLPSTRIADVQLLSVRNATTGQMARTLDVAADGRFTADVPLATGANRLVVQVQGAGDAGTATLTVHYRPDVKIEVERPRDVEIKVEPEKPLPK